MAFTINNVEGRYTLNGIDYNLNLDSIDVVDSRVFDTGYPADGSGDGLDMITGAETSDNITCNMTYLSEALNDALNLQLDALETGEPNELKRGTLTVISKQDPNNKWAIQSGKPNTRQFQNNVDTSPINKYSIPIVGKITTRGKGNVESVEG